MAKEKDPNYAAPLGKTRVVRVYEHGIELFGDYDTSGEALEVSDTRNLEARVSEHPYSYAVYNDAGELVRGKEVLTNILV